jgi:hypothetical protein
MHGFTPDAGQLGINGDGKKPSLALRGMGITMGGDHDD